MTESGRDLRQSSSSSEPRLHRVIRRAFLAYLRVNDLWRPSIGWGQQEIDVVILVGPRDLEVVHLAVEGVRRNLRDPVRRLTLISPDEIQPHLAALFPELPCLADEDVLSPATLERIASVPLNNAPGWLLQQLVKLAVLDFTQCDNVLVLDADTVLVRPQSFFVKGLPILLCSDEYNQKYFDFIACLLGPSYRRPLHSCIAHQMLFNREVLESLRSALGADQEDWMERLLEALETRCPGTLSEYELYGQWALRRQPRRYRRVYWRNLPAKRRASSVAALEEEFGNHRSVSLHYYL